MKLNLFHRPDAAYEHIDIVYRKMTTRLESLIEVIEQGTPHLEGRDEDGIVSFPFNQVFYFETVDRRSYAYLEKQVYQVSITLGEAERLFSAHGFCRINKSQVLNLYCIRRVRPTAGMRIAAQMENGEELVINRSYRRYFDQALSALGGDEE